MKDFNNRGGNRSGGGDRGGFRGGNNFNDRGNRGGDRGGRENPQMHTTTCSDCGNSCEVPFRPTGEKPVFCNNCFAGKRDNDSRSFDRGSREDRPRRDFSPKPAFNHSAPTPAPDKRVDDLKRQIDAVNGKIDTIIKLIQDSGIVKSSAPKKEESLTSVVKKAQVEDKAEKPKKTKAAPAVKETAPKKEVKAVKKSTDKKPVKAPAAKKVAKTTKKK